MNQRSQFAKQLVNHMKMNGELYNKNVNGRNSSGQQRKERINPMKIEYIRGQTFRFIPCLPSETKTAWSECVKVIDKANIYLFSVLQKNLTFEPLWITFNLPEDVLSIFDTKFSRLSLVANSFSPYLKQIIVLLHL